MSTDDLREKLADELSGFPIGTGYYQTTVGTNEAREMADALLPIIDAHTAAAVAEVREQIAARLDRHESVKRASSAENPSELWAQRDYSAAVAFGVAARIARGQA